MSRLVEDAVARYLRDSCAVLERAADDAQLRRSLAAIADCMTRTFRAGGKVLLAGNGGSAADAQHIAAEFLSRFKLDRSPLPAIALTTDSSVLTAIGNDYGYDKVFERQILGLGAAGDVFIAISTSGRSPNILRAITAAKEKQLVVVGFTGNAGGEMKSCCDICLRAPSDSTPLIQQIHITAAHIICGLVEARLFPRVASTTAKAAAHG
jgi:D-sedoheptulose 7-phosphate isomerase